MLPAGGEDLDTIQRDIELLLRGKMSGRDFIG